MYADERGKTVGYAFVENTVRKLRRGHKTIFYDLWKRCTMKRWRRYMHAGTRRVTGVMAGLLYGTGMLNDWIMIRSLDQ